MSHSPDIKKLNGVTAFTIRVELNLFRSSSQRAMT